MKGFSFTLKEILVFWYAEFAENRWTTIKREFQIRLSVTPGSFFFRYLDSVTNKDSTLPPIPHLHSLLSDDVEPYPEVDIFRLIRTSYEVGLPGVTTLHAQRASAGCVPHTSTANPGCPCFPPGSENWLSKQAAPHQLTASSSREGHWMNGPWAIAWPAWASDAWLCPPRRLIK